MKLVAWNVRGLGGASKVSMLQKLVRENQVTFIGIIETKKSSFDRNQAARLWGVITLIGLVWMLLILLGEL